MNKIIPLVSVLIPTFRREEKVIKCLLSVVEQDYPKEKVEVVVFDDNSGEEHVKKLETFVNKIKDKGFVRVELIKSEVNVGLVKARNFLAKRIGENSNFIFFLDDDVYLREDVLNVLVEYMLKDERVGIIGPKIVYYTKPDKVFISTRFVGKFTGKYYCEDTEEILECDVIEPGCMLLRREVIERLNGFSEEFVRSHEGVDFCLRARKLGYKVVYNPNIVVEHDIELNPPSSKRLYYTYRNKIFIMKRHLPWYGKIISLVGVVFFAFPKYIVSSILRHKRVVFEELWIIIKAVYDGIMGLSGRRV